MSALVYGDGTNQPNVLEVTLGDAGVQLSWSGSAPGMRWVRAAITLDRPGGQLGMRLIRRGKRAVVVDSLEFYPLVEGECSAD